MAWLDHNIKLLVLIIESRKKPALRLGEVLGREWCMGDGSGDGQDRMKIGVAMEKEAALGFFCGTAGRTMIMVDDENEGKEEEEIHDDGDDSEDDGDDEHDGSDDDADDINDEVKIEF